MSDVSAKSKDFSAMTKKRNCGTLEEEEVTTEGEPDCSKEGSEPGHSKDADADGSENRDDDEEDEDDDEEEEMPEVEPLAPNRLRRSNAGNRMHELMGSAVVADEFYESAYGGFNEDDDMDEFAPADDTEEDEVDSDFDRSEDDEAEERLSAAGEDEDSALRKAELQELLAKNRKWAVARFNKCTVVENVCDPKTQRERLEEAKITEELNIASLKRFEEFELERRKRQMKPSQKRIPLGPIVSLISRGDIEGGRLLVVPDVQPFTNPAQRKYYVCAVTGKPARYVDPLTGFPYADASAFRKIREDYRRSSPANSKKHAMEPAENDNNCEMMDVSVSSS